MIPAGWWFLTLTIHLANPVEVRVALPTRELCEQARANMEVQSVIGYSNLVCRQVTPGQS